MPKLPLHHHHHRHPPPPPPPPPTASSAAPLKSNPVKTPSKPKFETNLSLHSQIKTNHPKLEQNSKKLEALKGVEHLVGESHKAAFENEVHQCEKEIVISKFNMHQSDKTVFAQMSTAELKLICKDYLKKHPEAKDKLQISKADQNIY